MHRLESLRGEGAHSGGNHVVKGRAGVVRQGGQVGGSDLAGGSATDDEICIRRAEAEAEDVTGRLENELRVDGVGEVPEQDVAGMHLPGNKHPLLESLLVRSRDGDDPFGVWLPLRERDHTLEAVGEMVERIDLGNVCVWAGGGGDGGVEA